MPNTKKINMKKEINYGALLESKLKDMGASKKRVCIILAINYRTLLNRFKDGEFTVSQINKLKERGYL